MLQKPAHVRRQISLTGQYTALDEVLTGRENLRLIGQLRHLPDAKQKTEELLTRFDLIDAADKPALAYSGGMRRRLDLAMSLMGSPPILFLDEPTTGLDPQSRLSMWRIIKGLARGGTTVFLTTQYLEEAEQLADNIAILDGGEIVAEGTAAQLKKMIPRGHMELHFHDEDQSTAARKLLKEFEPKWAEEPQALLIPTDGSAKQTAQILGLLENAQLDVAEFAHKLPTLEDVFLTVIGHDQKKERE